MESLRPQLPKEVGHESFPGQLGTIPATASGPAQTIDSQRKARLTHKGSKMTTSLERIEVAD
jgi:hypothetical protein